MSARAPAAPPAVLLPAKSLGKQQTMGHLDKAPGSWLPHGPALEFVAILGVSQQIENYLPVSLSLTVTLSNKSLKKKKANKKN